MFIIEGPDMAGKTTAAKRIVELCHAMGYEEVEYSHLSRPPETWNYGSDYMPLIRRNRVQDRFHFGGLVYGDLCRGDTKISPEKLRIIEALLMIKGRFTVLYTLTPDMLEHQFELCKDRKEMYDLDTIQETNARFSLMGFGRIPQYAEAKIDRFVQVGSVEQFPDDELLTEWIKVWRSRVDAVTKFFDDML